MLFFMPIGVFNPFFANTRMPKDFNWKLFSTLIKKVIDFKTKTSFTYVNADAWEEVLYFSLKKMGEKPDWRLGSHAKGADITTSRFAISAKSGKISGGSLIISSYRLTRYTNLKQMADFIDDEKNYDFYLCCARNADTNGRAYAVYKIPSNVFIAKDCVWSELKNKTGKCAGYSCTSKNGVHAEIRKKMSNQLWLSIPLNLCEKILEVNYQNKEIGSEFEKIFN